jgi:prepilin peptidase CpaA
MNLSMSGVQLIWSATLVLTAVAAYTDLLERRIPNWLTAPGLFVGLTLHAWLAGWRGVLTSLEGAGLALVILLPLVLMRGLGAGDWKLMGAVGAFLGPWMMLFVLVASFFVTGLVSIVRMAAMGKMKSTLRNMMVLVQGFIAFGMKPNPEISLDTPGLIKLPFGATVAVGTLICFVAAHWVR